MQEVILSFRPMGLFQARLWFTEITKPSAHGSWMEFQPFMDKVHLNGCDALLVYSAQTAAKWSQLLSAEQTAYALGQVTTARALPALTEFVSASMLLDSRIHLREFLDDSLVEAISKTLENEAALLQWRQLEATSYVYVIGAGAAVCIETTYGDEKVYLRYANHIAEAIAQAQNEKELPRSLLGLQINLQECIDILLAHARSKTFAHLLHP
ncbi:MAG: hypothetical protein GC179_04590 [Anaerolineaceae bacterium]|nr:hypothetical protein [Anaerolineaceae bacterium]